MRMIATGCVAVLMMVTLWVSSAIGAPTDACALLTPAQVGAALGGSVGPGKAIASTVCQWTQQGKAGDTLLKLDVNIVTLDRYTRSKTVTAGKITNVNGLGDDAFYSTLVQGTTTLTTLYVKKGDGAVAINVTGGKQAAEVYQAKEKAAAVALVPKL